VGIINKLLQIFTPLVTVFLDWWTKRETAQKQDNIESRNADIRNDPADQWLRKFNSQANTPAPTSQTGTDQPNRNT
jgi:hypothetical protein